MASRQYEFLYVAVNELSEKTSGHIGHMKMVSLEYVFFCGFLNLCYREMTLNMTYKQIVSPPQCELFSCVSFDCWVVKMIHHTDCNYMVSPQYVLFCAS